MRATLESFRLASFAPIAVLIFTAGTVTLALSGCGSSSVTERYVSPHVEGENAKINLEAVQKAFWETKGSDLNGWMAAFEKRVNEIYDGKEIVSIDATRQDKKLVVTGYFDTQKKQGFVAGDEKLFTIEQTGEAVNNEMPYRMSGQDGRVYYEGSHSILDNPFFQALLISHMFNSWGGHYYTPYDRVSVLQNYRSGYRMSPSWSQQQSYNDSFTSRYKTKAIGGGLESRNKFGSSNFSTSGSTTNRSWGSSISSPSGSATSSGWGGRRSSSGFSSAGVRPFGGSWGGRRR